MKKKLFSILLLFSLSLLLMPYDACAVGTRQVHQTQNRQTTQENKKVTIDESITKLVCLRWSKLTKEDAWNFAKIGLTVGGLYVLFKCAETARAEQERRYAAYARRVQQQEGQQRKQDDSPQDWQQPQYRDPRPQAVLSQRVILAKDVECSICMDDFDVVREVNQLSCGTKQEPHRFCSSCLDDRIRIQLRELQLPTCPHHGCNEPLSERVIRLVTLNDPSTIERFDQATRNSIISALPEHEQAIFCPGANCMMYWVADKGQKMTVTCSKCFTRFCSACQHNHDQNISCEQAKQSKEENENDKWIHNNTRPCPTCMVNVERREGCNHMTCRCGNHFCWNCGQRATEGRSLLMCDSFTCRTANKRVWGG